MTANIEGEDTRKGEAASEDVMRQQRSDVPEDAYQKEIPVHQEESAEGVQTFGELYPKLQLLGIQSETQLRNMVLERRLTHGDSWRVLSDLTGIPHTTLFSNYASVEKIVREQFKRTPSREVARGSPSHSVAEPNTVSTLQGIPSPSLMDAGDIVLSPEDQQNVLAGLPPREQRIVKAQFLVSDQRRRDQVASARAHDGFPSGNQSERPLTQREILVAAQTQQLINSMNPQRNDGENPSLVKAVIDGQKSIIETLSKIAFSPTSGPDRLGDYRLGVTDARENLKASSSNIFDVEMQKARLDHDSKLGDQDTQKVWAATLEKVGGPLVERVIGGAVSESGKAIIDSMKNAPTNIASFTCPSCSSELQVPIPPNAPADIPIKCPKCHTVTPAKLGTPQQSKPQKEEHPKVEPPPEEQPPIRKGKIRPTYT